MPSFSTPEILISIAAALTTIIEGAYKFLRFLLTQRQFKQPPPDALAPFLEGSQDPEEDIDRYWDGRLFLVERSSRYSGEGRAQAVAEEWQHVPPRVLLSLANTHARDDDLNGAETLLRALLIHPDADSTLLQEGEFIARTIVQDYRLAEKLNSRALGIDPENVRSQVRELIFTAGREKTDDGFNLIVDSLLEIAFTFNYDRKVLTDIIEFLIQQKRTQVLLDLTADLIEANCPFGCFVWLSKASAQRLAEANAGEVQKSYKMAIEEARRERLRTGNGVDDLRDALVAFARYLTVRDAHGNAVLVKSLLKEAQAVSPKHPAPVEAFAVLYRLTGQDATARAYERRADMLREQMEVTQKIVVMPDYGEARSPERTQ